MKFYGDVKVKNTDDGGAIQFYGGQPEMEDGLGTSVYLSLFTDSGWWGDPEIGSNLSALEDSSLTNAVRLEAIKSAEKALAWMKAQGIAAKVVVDAEIPSPSMLALQVTIYQPGTTDPDTYRFAVSWRGTKEAL